MEKKPYIGVFDSGIGGLTVLKCLIKSYPNESFIYLGDTARLPYGTKSKGTIYNYVMQNIKFLTKYNLKSVVIACHSASSAVLSTDFNFDFPVYNMIQPSCTEAISLSVSKKIGILGTRATTSAGIYEQEIQKIDKAIKIKQIACPLFVPLVEEGYSNDPVTELIAVRYLKPLIEAKVDTVILACTHYPVLKNIIQKILGPHIKVIDPAESLSASLSESLSVNTFDISTKKNLKGEKNSLEPPDYKFLVTDILENFSKISEIVLGDIKFQEPEQVDISSLI